MYESLREIAQVVIVVCEFATLPAGDIELCAVRYMTEPKTVVECNRLKKDYHRRFFELLKASGEREPHVTYALCVKQ